MCRNGNYLSARSLRILVGGMMKYNLSLCGVMIFIPISMGWSQNKCFAFFVLRHVFFQ